MAKYIFVTGGVASSVGKGITVASIGRLLKSDQVLMQPDRERRAAYEARVAAEVRRVPSAPAGQSAEAGSGAEAAEEATQPQTKAASGTAGVR